MIRMAWNLPNMGVGARLGSHCLSLLLFPLKDKVGLVKVVKSG
jgi:hypothetical protein